MRSNRTASCATAQNNLRHDLHLPVVDLDRNIAGIGFDVVVPRRVLVAAGVGRDNVIAAVALKIPKRGADSLSRLASLGGEDEHFKSAHPAAEAAVRQTVYPHMQTKK